MYSPNRTTGQWPAHGRYIARASATQGHAARAFGDQREVVAPPEFLNRWQKAGDPRLWKMIITPEFGERIDLNQLTGDLMTKMEKDLDTRLEWIWFRCFRFLVSTSRPQYTRTSQVRVPRRMFWPTLRAIETPPPVRGEWHTMTR
jgi:hypothetical protein